MVKKLFYPNSKGDKLCAILSTPQKKTDSIAILVHGHSSNKNSQTNMALAKILNKKNIDTFRIDLYGHGESAGKLEETTISKAADSILSAIKFLKTCGFKKIALMGSSFGGIASIIAAFQNHDLTALALKSPVSNYADLLFKRPDSFYKDAVKNDGYKAILKIKIPIFIVHGDKDLEVPIGQSQKLVKLNKRARLEIIKGADHRYTNPDHSAQMVKLLSDFIISHLQPQP